VRAAEEPFWARSDKVYVGQWTAGWVIHHNVALVNKLSGKFLNFDIVFRARGIQEIEPGFDCRRGMNHVWTVNER
jgi:hypothetical protein